MNTTAQTCGPVHPKTRARRIPEEEWDLYRTAVEDLFSKGYTREQVIEELRDSGFHVTYGTLLTICSMILALECFQPFSQHLLTIRVQNETAEAHSGQMGSEKKDL